MADVGKIVGMIALGAIPATESKIRGAGNRHVANQGSPTWRGPVETGGRYYKFDGVCGAAVGMSAVGIEFVAFCCMYI